MWAKPTESYNVFWHFYIVYREAIFRYKCDKIIKVSLFNFDFKMRFSFHFLK